MVIDSKEEQDIFVGEEDIVVFAVNTEGINDAGFAGIVARKGWPELANMGECQLGDVFEKEIDGKRYCAIVCHSLSKIDGWGTPEEQTQVIKDCFNKIETREGDVISSIAIGNGFIGKMSGANYEAIVMGMHESDKDVVLYGKVPEKIMLKVETENLEDTEKVEEPKIDKFKIPYYQVAKEALMNWNGLSEEEAIRTIETSSFDEIESQVWAKSSMMHAVEGIAKSIDLSKEDEDELKEFVLTGKADQELLERAREGIVKNIPVKVLMDSLSEVHSGWVQENEKKFMAREKKHQHMPFELIGWNEAKAYLLFANPIFLGIGVGISRPLEYDYQNVVIDYLLENNIITTEDLVEKISRGEEFYSALKGQTSITEKLSDTEYVRTTVIPQIEEKGIGKIEDVRTDMLKRIARNPLDEDLERLTTEEREYVSEYLDIEIEEKTAAIEEQRRKSEIIERIKQKSEKLKKLRKEYHTINSSRDESNREDN